MREWWCWCWWLTVIGCVWRNVECWRLVLVWDGKGCCWFFFFGFVFVLANFLHSGLLSNLMIDRKAAAADIGRLGACLYN
jgi:hypothetical protein